MSTNGASLEDCHTNVFVLTELNGLKWKKFTCGQGSARGCTEIGEDAVLRAYGRCLSDNMLCAWRRVPGGGHGYPGNLGHKIELRLDAEKELWVFWYAEEPDNLESFTKTLNSPEEARGSYAQSGIEYETRTLLFKALHNLVERRLLSKGFIRLGKWFTHPHDTPTSEAEQANKSDVVAFNFSFFVHGENSVCVSVNTQRQPAVFHLSKRHLTSEQKQNVILAPWSLKAQLISNPESSPSAGDRYWTEWSQFYPVLGADDNTENLGYVDPVEKERQERAKAAALPKMVLVEVAGVRMYYPTCYVAVVSSEDSSLLSQQNQQQQQSTGPHASPSKDGKGTAKRRAEETTSDGEILGLMHGRVVSGARVLQRAVEEINLMRRTPNGQSPAGDTTPAEPADDQLLRWNVIDCCKKDVCPCRLPTGLVASKAAHKFGVAGQGPSKQAKLSRGGAFHRRSPLTIRSEPSTPPILGGDDFSHESVRTPASARPGSVKPPLSATMSGGQPHSVSYAPLSVSSQSAASFPAPSYQNISPVAPSRTQSPMVDDGVARTFLTDARLPPVNAAPRKPSIVPPRALKRPKLDELDLFQLGLNVKEQLAHNMLLGQNYDARPPWCDAPDEDDDEDEVNIVAELVQAPVASSSLPGLIEIRAEANPVVRGEPTTILEQMLQADDDDPVVTKAAAVGDQKPTFTAANDLQPSVAMPDNFLDTSPTVSHGVLSSSSALSPPASNERVDQQPTTMPAPAVPSAMITSSTQPQFRTTGPPSVGAEYNRIYPTPPSIEAFHPQQFSPQNLHLQQIATETVPIGSPADYSTESTTRSTTIKPLVIVARPQTAIYLTSSKFFGTTSLKSRASSITAANMSALKYNPSPQTKMSTDATPSSGHPTMSQTSHLIQQQQQSSVSIFPSQSQQQQQQQQQMLYGRQTGHFGGNFSQQQQQPPPLHQGHFGANQPPQQSHLGGMAHYNNQAPTISNHLNNASPQPFGGISAPIIQRHPSFPSQGSPYGVQPMSANPRTPGSSQPPQLVDIQSPLSNASSYVRGVNSVEAAPNGSCSVGPGARMPEAHGLVVALLMSDTIIDLHYDASFDSCPICSCNSNIRGAELGIYLTPPDCPPNPHGGFSVGQSQQPRCNCGFRAVRHRFLSMQAGLFNEDQWEATGVCAQPSLRRPLVNASVAADRKIIDLVRQQTLIRDLAPLIASPIMLATQCALATKEMRLGLDITQPFDYTMSVPETTELNGMCNSAMEAACMAMDCTTPSRNDYSRGGAYKSPTYLHDWGLQRASAIAEPNDAEWLAVLNELLPVLQELSHLPANVVQGPLTWRALDRKLGKATTDDECRPEPVPQILVSMERDPLAVSPQTLRLWERLMLEPYDQPKDIVYVGVVPDNAVVVERAKIFFSELSKTYENCRYGRHLKFSKGNGDGLIRVGSKNVRQDDRVDEWFTTVDGQMENKALVAKLRAYANLCENSLGPLLENENVFDRQVFKDVLIRENQQPLRSNESMPPPPTPGNAADASVDGASASTSTEGQCVDPEVNTDLPHVVVVYLVNPFMFGADTHDEQTIRYCTLALLKAFLGLLKRVDKKRRPFVQLEIVQLQTVFDCTATINDEVKDDRGAIVPFDAGVAERRFSQRLSATDTLKSLALSVFSQTRQLLPDCITTLQAKSMTGFGPAAATREIITKMDVQPSPSVYKIYCTPCVLAPNSWQKPTGGKDGAGGALMLGAPTKEESVLFISYCLMEQRWLAATATDHQGHMLENCLINLDYVAQQQGNVKFKAGSLIRDALDRLWQFIMGALSMGCRNWRLVIGRVGRLGHGELKAWAQMLGRPNLKRYSQTLKEHCSQCQLMPGFHETPSLLSACLISTEPEPSVRVFSSSVIHDDRLQGAKPSKQRPLRTPEDASCTHILVYPTSACLSLSEHGPGQPGQASGLEGEDDFGLLEIGPDDDFQDILGDANDIFNDMPSSAALTSAGPNVARGTSVFFSSADQTDTVQIDNQPLATGFYISTAPTGGLPDWFWSSCPAAKRRSPVHLKSSLHLHTPHVQQNDELTFGGSSKASSSQQHPLDSTRTDDALKYVLETYNSLSWLNVDLVTGERRSCLPVHIQALLRLYNSVQRLL